MWAWDCEQGPSETLGMRIWGTVFVHSPKPLAWDFSVPDQHAEEPTPSIIFFYVITEVFTLCFFRLFGLLLIIPSTSVLLINYFYFFIYFCSDKKLHIGCSNLERCDDATWEFRKYCTLWRFWSSMFFLVVVNTNEQLIEN